MCCCWIQPPILPRLSFFFAFQFISFLIMIICSAPCLWAVGWVVTLQNSIDPLQIFCYWLCRWSAFITDGPFDSQLVYLHLVRKYVRLNRSCTFCQPWGFLHCCRIIPTANSAYRMEGVTKAIMNFGWTRKWTDLLSQHFRVRPEENVEHPSHDMRSKIESDTSVIYYSST
jgi:hypothetical protein